MQRRLVAAWALLVQRLAAAGADARITVYASAGCRFEERERGRLVNAATGGPDDAARAAVHADVIDFLRAAFALPR